MQTIAEQIIPENNIDDKIFTKTNQGSVAYLLLGKLGDGPLLDLSNNFGDDPSFER